MSCRLNRGDLMTKEEDQLRKIEEILLKHVGRKNAIFASEIAKQVGIRDNDTYVNTRMLIRKLMKQKQLPIGADQKIGYFIIENKKELAEYVKDLDKRMQGMATRKYRAMIYFESYYQQDLSENEVDENGGEEI
jgi:hypothetical protein